MSVSPVIESKMSGAAGLEASRLHCTQVTRSRAGNFYYGMKLVPEPRRSAMYAIYAWMRQADDLADDAGDQTEKTRRLDEFWRLTEQELDRQAKGVQTPGSEGVDGAIWPAFGWTVREYGIERRHLRGMIEGQLLDMGKSRYATFEELYDYCYKVASVVGLTCIQVWGYEGGERARKMAEWRGIAFQLTNILRDIREDAERGRVYLPAEDFEGGGPEPEELLKGPSERLMKGIGRTLERARRYYEDSAELDKLVEGPGKACLWAMSRIYRTLLERIEADPRAVLMGRRVKLSKISKTMIALKAWWKFGGGGA